MDISYNRFRYSVPVIEEHYLVENFGVRVGFGEEGPHPINLFSNPVQSVIQEYFCDYPSTNTKWQSGHIQNSSKLGTVYYGWLRV